MTSAQSGTRSIGSEQDVVLARQAVRKVAQETGMRLVDQTKLVTAASELARNTLIYGGGGFMDWEVVKNGSRKGIRLQFRDEGPGIPDIKRAMTDGWTSGDGLGLGLSGAKRLMDDFELQSEVGKGTSVAVVKWI
jgi:serine/threonine-protein kinase RsbT